MLNFEKIKPYLKCDQNGLPIDKTLFHAGYEKSVKMAQEIAEVFSEEYPAFMIKKRPKEKKEHIQYRKDFYYNIVGKFRTKALSMITAVYQNDDFNVIFNKDNDFKEYTESKEFDNLSLPEWFFGEWAKSYIDDPNTVIAPIFKDFASTDQEYNSPTMKLFSSEGVIQLNKDIAVLRGDEKTWITTSTGNKVGREKIGRNLYFYDKDSFVIAKQTGIAYNNKETNYTWEIIGQNVLSFEGTVLDFEPFQTNTTKIPAQRIGRILGEKVDGEVQLYRSEISDALPFLKRILQRSSDSEIEFLLHIHTIEWYITTKHQCNEPGCNKGYIETPNFDDPTLPPIKRKCPKCDDKGVPINGFQTIIHTVNDKPLEGTNNIAGPFGGYIERNVETVRELRAEIMHNEAAAYNSLDMLWLFQTPLNTSGKSKAYDRQEYYRREADISMHCKKQIDFCYETTAIFRNGITGSIENIVPVVNVPQDSFDISTQEEVLEELKTLDGTGVDGNMYAAMQLMYAKKRFGKDTTLTKILELKIYIDPFLSVKNNKIQNLDLAVFNEIKIFGRESQRLREVIKKYYLSKYLDSIITDLMIEREDFLDWDRKRQVEAIELRLEEYIPETISEEVYTTLKQEPAVDVETENQAVLN